MIKKHVRKNNLKNNRGAISLIVAVTVLSFMAILMGALVTITTLRHSQQESNLRIQEIYGKDYDDIDSIYNSLYNNGVVCKIGDKEYFSLGDALNDVPADKTKTIIKIMRNTESNITIPNTKNVVLDLDGYTLDGNIVNNGTLTIEGNGVLTRTKERIIGAKNYLVSNTGKLIVNSGYFKEKNEGGIYSSNILNFNGGRVEAELIGIYIARNGSEISTISGGEIFSRTNDAIANNSIIGLEITGETVISTSGDETKDAVYNNGIMSISLDDRGSIYANPGIAISNHGDLKISDTKSIWSYGKGAGKYYSTILNHSDGGFCYIKNSTIANKTDNGYAISNLSETSEVYALNCEISVNVSNVILNKRDGSWNGFNNSPKIDGTGLTAVYWSGTEWVKLNEDSSQTEWNKWYDYDNKNWANAQSADGSLWVWIPRYEYKIDSATKSINVRFISTDVKNGTNGYTADSTGIISSTDGYIIHPAFMDDSSNNFDNGGWDKELDGFWVAKYAAGFQNGTVGEEIKTVIYSDLKYTTTGDYTSNYLDADFSTNTNISYPVFKANTYMYNLISVGDAYLLSKKIGTESMYGLINADSHLEKNSEWGAVAYLTHSKYGVNGNSSDMNEVEKNGKKIVNTVYVYNNSSKKANLFAITSFGINDTPNNPNASTTKNITGVFDMNGGIWERVAVFKKGGSAEDTVWHSAMADASTANSTKYVTLYESMNKKGDATEETKGWNSDWYGSLSNSSPIIARGGTRGDDDRTGIFSYVAVGGFAANGNGFRCCLVF